MDLINLLAIPQSAREYHLSIIIPTLMRSRARVHLCTLLEHQSAADEKIEIIYIGPSGDSRDITLFYEAVEKVRNRTALKIVVFLGGTSVYEAMNCGIAHASGKYLFFCGDTDTPLRDNIISHISDCIFLSNDQFCGPVLLGRVQKSCQVIRARLPMPRGLTLALERNPTHHQGIAYPSEVFLLVGLYSQAFMVLGDYEFHLRLRSYMYKNSHFLSALDTNAIFCCFEDGGLSGTCHVLNYIESFRCKEPYLNRCFLPVAWLVELLAYLLACARRQATQIYSFYQQRKAALLSHTPFL